MNATLPGLAAHVLDLVKVHRRGGIETTALNHVTSSFAPGVITAVLGPSGAGKTSLFNILGGLDHPTSGRVAVGGHDLPGMTDRQLTRLRRTDISLVLEGGDLVPTLSTRENLMLPSSLAVRKPDRDWFDAVVSAAGLGDWLGVPPVALTPMQQQLLAVARALMSRPTVVLADEPTGRLNSGDGDEVITLLSWARQAIGQAVILFTHDPIVAAAADRALLLVDGEVLGDIPDPTPVSVLTKIAELDARRTARTQG